MDKSINCFLKLLFVCVLSCSLFSAKAFAANQNEEESDVSFLEPDQAFSLQVTPLKDNASQAKLQFTIAEGYKLYQKQFKFSNVEGTALQTNDVSMPAAEGQDKVYHHKLEMMVPIVSKANSTSNVRGIYIQYQGCSEAGFCYPPIRKQIQINKDNTVTVSGISAEQFNKPFSSTSSSLSSSSLASSDAAATSAVVSDASDQDSADYYANLLENNSLSGILLTFFGIGILLAFTPCVLPMVPILANILVGQQQPLSRKRSFTLSGLYVLSMALCYAAAGLAAGMLGSHLSNSLQQPLVLISLSFLLLMFALSQLSIISVQTPAFITNAFQKLGAKEHKSGSAIGAVSMGAVSALVASPCVTPALIGSLTYIAQKGNVQLGGLALFVLALGMGFPLLIAASIGSHLLPKVGHWMNYIKNVTGILLLVLAGSILFRAIPVNAESTNSGHVAQTQAPFTHIRSSTELTEAIKVARAANKPVILDVYADWCVSCRQMDKEVFEDKAILNTLSNVQLLRLDLTKETKDIEALRKELGIIGPPMVLFFNPKGEEVKAYRLAGKPKSSSFVERVTKFLNETNKKK